jgi:hypothetical protein
MVYNNAVCLGNWFEDRVQGPNSGTSRVLCDYGVRIYETDSQFQARKTAAAIDKTVSAERNRGKALKRLADSKSSGGFAMAQAKTYHDSVVDRISSKPETGFKALLPPKSQEQMVDMTSCNHHAYGNPGRESSTAKKALRASDATFAGQGKPKGPKAKADNMKLAGEVWQGGDDPQKNTLSQRAWMYGPDAAIQYKLNGYPALRPEDVECTGFQVGSEHERPYNPNGNFKRVAKITKASDPMGSNNRTGKNIWMDMM